MLMFYEKVVNSSRNTYILSLAVYIVSYEQGLLFGNDYLGIQAMTHPETKHKSSNFLEVIVLCRNSIREWYPDAVL